jgi:hypothetical protein
VTSERDRQLFEERNRILERLAQGDPARRQLEARLLLLDLALGL